MVQMSMRQVHNDNKDKASTKILAFSSKLVQILIYSYLSQNSIFCQVWIKLVTLHLISLSEVNTSKFDIELLDEFENLILT